MIFKYLAIIPDILCLFLSYILQMCIVGCLSVFGFNE